MKYGELSLGQIVLVDTTGNKLPDIEAKIWNSYVFTSHLFMLKTANPDKEIIIATHSLYKNSKNEWMLVPKGFWVDE